LHWAAIGRGAGQQRKGGRKAKLFRG
jgi:hypothetical protein